MKLNNLATKGRQIILMQVAVYSWINGSGTADEAVTAGTSLKNMVQKL